MAGWLQAISDVLPLTYAVEALQEVGAHAEPTGTMWRDLGDRGRRCVVLRPGAGRGDPAAAHRLSDREVDATARRTGRRPGNPDTREAILAAAREAFAERGFDGASIRAIATAAGVDPALVHHYFGTKEQLFLAAMQVADRPGASCIPQVARRRPRRRRRAAGPHVPAASGTRPPARPAVGAAALAR